MKIALVYDRVNKFGGAERVLLALRKMFPTAPLYTLVHDPKAAPWSRNFHVISTFFNKIKYFRRHHEIIAPFSALAFETFNLNDFEVVISITSDQAKAVITKPETLHICYCLTPTRYLYTGANDYRNHFFSQRLFDKYLSYARRADQVYASRPDVYLSISQEVAARVKKYYLRDSEIIYPPVNFEFFKKTSRYKKRDFYLVVSRLVPYKRLDLVITAFNKLKLPLVIVGSGSDGKRLQKLAGETIEFVGQISDEKLRQIYASARALIFPQVEDFGLVPLEAAAAGTPTLAFAGGGSIETIIDGQTGLFFEKQSSEAIIDALQRFESGSHQIGAKKCQEQAKRFDESGFRTVFSAKVNQLYETHRNRWGSG